MRQPRFTYPGAYHHCMNLGINGEAIFKGEKYKTVFLDMLADKVDKFRMRLFAYCLMDNHYHLVLENASGRMSDFFRNLNTQYAFYYRKQTGGKGYVFQSRFISTIIQNDAYLKQAIVYVLQNPVQAGISDNFRQYPWSSAKAYFQKTKLKWLDGEFVQGLFGSQINLAGAIQLAGSEKLSLLKTRLGPVLGDESFVEKALERYERRLEPDGMKKKRRDDFYFEPVAKVIQEFERDKGIKIEDINVGNWQGKRLRTELLVLLHDLTGLKYREIIEIPIFSDLHYLSMSRLYHNFRKKKETAK
jgi:REP element-mobilizing transposase RayT